VRRALASLGAPSPTLGHALLRRGLLVGAALVAFALGCAVPALAADPPACPPTPEAYTGTDAVVAELRAQRADVAASCAAAHFDAGLVESALNAIRDHQSDPVRLADGSTVAIAGAVELVRGTADAPLHVTSEDPAPASSTVALSTADRQEQAANTEQVAFWLRFGVGVMLVMLVAPIVRRIWTP
jgi:hypothetical protein